MGLADIFKTNENKFLREKNNELQRENSKLREELKKLTAEFINFKQKNKLSEDASVLYSDWIMEFSEEYANILCSKFPEYSYLDSFKSNYKYRHTYSDNKLQELIKQAAYYKAIKNRYPFIIEAINNGMSENVDYYIKTIRILEKYSYEDLKLLQSDIRIFEKKHQNNEMKFLKKEKELNKIFDEKFKELEEKEKSRQIYWNRMINNQKKELELIFTSSLNSLPYVASLSADYILYKINEMQSFLLNRNTKYAHEKEIKIRTIKNACRELIEEAKVAIYQLEYLKTLYPNLEEILDTEYNKLPFNLTIDNNADPISQWIKKEEYESLCETKRNQLALERYIESRKKTKWQIGRDYELSIGYQYEKKGYIVDYFGSLNGIEDLGRDLIAIKNGKYKIIQCKYWASEKTIHEKHIFQLYGSMLSFAIENHIDIKCVSGIFVTNIDFSDTAKKFAKMLGIVLKSRESFKEFPRIKCNISADGEKIYHLPMDQQYDNVKLVNSGETKVFTVKDAENLGFRRAWRWHGSE